MFLLAQHLRGTSYVSLRVASIFIGVFLILSLYPLFSEAQCGSPKSVGCANVPIIWTLTCSAAPSTSVTTGQTVTYTASPAASQGVNSFSYSWSGTDSLTGTTQSVGKSYSTAGAKTATVLVTAAIAPGYSGTATQSCTVNVTVGAAGPAPLAGGHCAPSPVSATTGQNVQWSITGITGGTGNYTYSWSGTDSLSGTGAGTNKVYTTAGVKSASVVVSSPGVSNRTVTCSDASVSPSASGPATQICNSWQNFTGTVGYNGSGTSYGPPAYFGQWSPADFTSGTMTRDQCAAWCATRTPVANPSCVHVTHGSSFYGQGGSPATPNACYYYNSLPIQSGAHLMGGTAWVVTGECNGSGGCGVNQEADYYMYASASSCSLLTDLTASNTNSTRYTPGVTWPVVGESVPFTGTVSTTGGSAANFPNIFQYTKDYSAYYSVNVQTHTLGANSSTGVSGNITFPSNGTWHVRTCADQPNTITETNESNNCSGWYDIVVAPSTPGGVAATCNANGTSANLSWNTVSGANHYYVRVAKPSSQSCPAGWVASGWDANVCIPSSGDWYTGTSIAFPTSPGTSYNWWVHGANSTGEWGNSNGTTFTCNGAADLTGTTGAASSGVAGTAVSLGGTATNSGTASTGVAYPNVVQVCDGSCATYNATTQIASAGPTGSGASSPAAGNVTMPSNPGVYYYRFCADFNSSWVGSVTETNPDNNCGGWSQLNVFPVAGGAPTATCNADGTRVTLNWTASPGAEGYYPRIYENTGPWGALCSAQGWQLYTSDPLLCYPNPDNVQTATTISDFQIVPGHSYGWWVHTYDAAAGIDWGHSFGGSFSCNGAPDATVTDTPANITRSLGQTIPVTGTTRNIGNVVSPASSALFITNWNGSAWGTFKSVPMASMAATNGSATVNYTFPANTFSAPGTYVYRICADFINDSWTSGFVESNEGNNCSSPGTITISNPTPIVDLIANPTTVVTGNSSTLTWSSSNATSCTGTGFSTGGALNNGTGVSTGPLTLATNNYQLSCTGPGGTVSDTATVGVTFPTVDLTVAPDRVKPGDSVTVTWSSSQCSNVTVTRNGTQISTGVLNQAAPGLTAANITTQTVFVATCPESVSARDTVIVNVLPAFEEF